MCGIICTCRIFRSLFIVKFDPCDTCLIIHVNYPHIAKHNVCPTNHFLAMVLVVNPRRACAARVTVVGLCVRPSVRPSVRPLIGNSLLERLLVLKTLSRTQWATKVKKFVGICLKPLRSRVMPRNKSEEANMLIIPTYPRSAFSA